jgi:hypothetical protein
MANASTAEIVPPVRINSSAFALPTSRGNRWVPANPGHRELAAAAKRESIDRRNDRFAEPLDEIEHALARSRTLPRTFGCVARNLGYIGAGDKGLVSCAGHDDAADRFILLKVEKGLPDFVERRRVERVQPLRTLNREHRHTGLTCDKQVVKGHLRLGNDA